MGALFPNFEQDAGEYLAAKEYWATMWERASSATTLSWETGWYGNPDQDGNPIFSAKAEGYVFRALMSTPEEDPHLGTYFRETMDDDKELVVHCTLFDETVPKIEALMRCWALDPELLLQL